MFINGARAACNKDYSSLTSGVGFGSGFNSSIGFSSGFGCRYDPPALSAQVKYCSSKDKASIDLF